MKEDLHLELLGKKAKDKITGYQGILTGKCYYLFGCAQYAINPGVGEDGKLMDIAWFDEGRIEVIEDFIDPLDVSVSKNGCENSFPSRSV